MAKTIHLEKNRFGYFQPISKFDESLCQDLPEGKSLKAKITLARSVPYNGRYWVMLTKVIKNQNYFPSAEVLHGAIKRKLGYSTTYRFRDGTEYHHEESTAFDSMDQIQFQLFYEQALQLICEEIIPNLDSDVLRKEMEGFL
ncbi:MAG: hypothetical protein COB29_13265 [Sulfitobacter sp.]|nr:MAG: hypothetical protein COB29_13265 [Sulfitobacter sp.]